MYRVEILYPNRPGSTFNLKHWFDVHLPMGLRLLRRHCGVSPVRIEAYPNIYGPPGVAAPYHLANALYFKSRKDADAFIQLFGIEEAARQLRSDWPNYTECDPEVIISEVVECDTVSGRGDIVARDS